MTKPKRLSEEGLHIRFAKKDMNWIEQEASHRRLTPTQLVRSAIFDWLQRNAQIEEPE